MRYLIAITLVAAFLAGGCSGKRETPPPSLSISNHDSQALLNFSRGRIFASQGRYELAREQFLMAYAASEGDVAVKTAAARQVEAMDLMIKTQR